MSMLNTQLYSVVSAALLHYTHNVLSTTAVAKYILNTMYENSNGLLKSPLPQSILYVTNDIAAVGDFLVDLTLHGLKQLLGVYV